jgi:hypothetical protein
MLRFLPVVSAAAALAMGAASEAAAQGSDPSPRFLGSPLATFSEPFSDISGIRQLSDGRLLVADRLEKAVRLLDARGEYLDDVGRVGSGPGEFQIPGGLLPLPGDSTLLVDFGNMRLSVIGPEGRIHRSTSMQQSYRHDGGAGVVMVMPRVSDDNGGLFFDTRGSFEVGPAGLPDSFAIVRWELDAERFDTVAMLPRPAAMQSISLNAGGGGKITGSGGGPLSPKPGWAAGRDGRAALVWAEPYRVEWVSRSGHRTAGPAVEYRPIPVTDADKAAWADRMGGSAVTVVSGGEGGRSFTIPRPDPSDMEWPEHKPAFHPTGMWTTPSGTLWVQRHVADGTPETFDLFDAQARLTDRVVLPEGRSLLGFGAGVVYLARTDADDLQWIERYRI